MDDHSIVRATELLSCRRADGRWRYGNYDVSETWKDVVPAGWELMATVPAYGQFWDDLLQPHIPDDIGNGPFVLALDVEYHALSGTEDEVLEVMLNLNDRIKNSGQKPEYIDNGTIQDIMSEAYDHNFFGRVTSHNRGKTILVRWMFVRGIEIRQLDLV